jgi:hypothetical protein
MAALARHTTILPLVSALLGTLSIASAGAADSEWRRSATVHGVVVEAKPTPSGFHTHRAAATVCAELETLLDYLSDATQIPSWLPYTDAARELESDAGTEAAVQMFYVRSATPWPMKPRDMVYRVYLANRADGTPVEASDAHAHGADGQMLLVLQGVPDHLPPQPGAVRMKSAEGAWSFEHDGERVRMSLRLQMDPGAVPKGFANRRMAATVGGALANLRRRFSCTQDAAAADGPTRMDRANGQGAGQSIPASAKIPPPS